MGKRELIALLSLSSWCLVMVVWLFLVVPWVCLRFDIVVFPDHTLLLFLPYFFTFKYVILVESPSNRMSAWDKYLQHRPAGLEEESIKIFIALRERFAVSGLGGS